MLRSAAPLAALAAFTAPLCAQSSSVNLALDLHDLGCQGPGGAIVNGIVVGADVTLNYDGSTGLLQIVVENTTPIVAGEATAVITRMFCNLPPGAVTSAALISQSGAGGATPQFALTFDPDTSAHPNPNSAGCLGRHSLALEVQGVSGGIANAQATSIAAPQPVLGPVTFEVQLAGPGAAGISAEAIAASYSRSGPTQTNVAMHFQAAGANGAYSGWVGDLDSCRTGIYTVGDTAVGQTFDLCVTGSDGCHVCLWVSGTPGPFVLGNRTLPIGLPLLAVLNLGFLGVGPTGASTCVPVAVPNNPGLAGFSLYMTNVSYHLFQPNGLSFSPAFTLTVK